MPSSPLPLPSMAPFSNYISFLFLTTLLLPLQIIARDSQFFSKVTHFDNNNNNVKETELPNKEGPLNKPEQQPVFTPETENSYGLYGHESSQLPSTTTTTTYQPYEAEFQHTSKYPNKYNYNNDAYNTNQNELTNTRLTGTGYRNSEKYYNMDAYGGNQNELSDTKYTEGEYNSMGNQNNYKKYHYNNNAAKDRYSYNNNVANNRNNGEKQGMSDTRFLEGGKYFYDLNYEKYNPTLYGDSSRGVNTNSNWYNNRGNHYGNNNNNGYQNQEEFEDEQEDFEP